MQGGNNPDLSLPAYEDLSRALEAREWILFARRSQLPVPAVIDRLIAAGLDSIPGGGAEILVDRVGKALDCYGKATAHEGLDGMRTHPRAGAADVRHGGDGRGAAGAPAAPSRAAGRNRRLHRVHHLELPARSHRARRI